MEASTGNERFAPSDETADIVLSWKKLDNFVYVSVALSEVDAFADAALILDATASILVSIVSECSIGIAVGRGIL